MGDYKNSYLTWNPPTLTIDNLLYAIALSYEYNCEKFDELLCISTLGEVRLYHDSVYIPPQYLKVSTQNAISQRHIVNKILSKLMVDSTTYKYYNQKVNRLTYEGLKREYENIPKEILDEIERLSNG